MLEITDGEFRLIADLVKATFGIHLKRSKRALVSGRLNRLIRNLGFGSFGDYYRYVVEDKTNLAILSLIDRITTNHSFFFREEDHFEFLKEQVLPEIRGSLGDNGLRDLRIWCAGCGAGEEAYSMAMSLAEAVDIRPLGSEARILATDISAGSLKKAAEGIYPTESVRAVPHDLGARFLRQHGPDSYAVVEEVKMLVLFKRLNLMTDPFPFKKPFHVVFCRNVMIYFDAETKKSLVTRIRRIMHDGAYLFVGHAESLVNIEGLVKSMHPSVYRAC